MIRDLDFPVFVKPAELGSSVGVSKATTDAELKEAIVGKSLAGVAAEQGVAVEELIEALVAPIAERLEDAVADGKLTQEEASERLAKARAHAEEAVNKVHSDRAR